MKTSALRALLTLFWLVPVVTLAQNRVTLSGYVRDGRSNESLIAATVYVKELGIGTQTNAYGFYSISMLPPLWQKITLFNPVVYLISGFRWSFYGISDVAVGVSLGMTLLFMIVCLVIVWWVFRTGYRLKA